MKNKKSLAIILLGLSFCFVPALGHGEVKEELLYIPTPLIHFFLSQARIDYIMQNPTIFLDIQFFYDPGGKFDEFFPEGIDTKDKIFVSVEDNRDVFSRRSRKTLLKIFKKALESIYSFVEPLECNYGYRY